MSDRECAPPEPMTARRIEDADGPRITTCDAWSCPICGRPADDPADALAHGREQHPAVLPAARTVARRPGLPGDLRALSRHLGVTPAAELADERRARAEHANIPPTTGDQP